MRGAILSPMSIVRQLLCVFCLAATTLAGATEPPNVILITLDTVRADRMGFLGSDRGLTRNLDQLARQSVVFTRAYSQVPLTAASHATILTGTYPQFHKISDFQVPLAQDLPYAPDILRSHGYHTAAFVSSMVLDPKQRFAPGFGRGFDTYDAGFRARQPGEDRYHTVERRGGEVVAHALTWLSEHSQGPFFVWVHLYDAHYPYDPPQPFKSKYASAPYDGEIAYVDSAVGEFLSQLRARGLFDSSVIAVMADHGESLGEHGEDFHGIFLYDETIHVPLMIKLPGGSTAGKRIESRVGLVDVLPTILQAVGVAVPQEVQGQSLLDMMTAKLASIKSGETNVAAETFPDRPAYAETDYAYRAYHWSPLRALRSGKYLYIKAPRPELYDQSTDPNSQHDLAAASAAVTSTLAAQLDAFRQKTASAKEASKSEMDPEAMEKLGALGYVATDPTATKSDTGNLGADPKDKIEIANMSERVGFIIDDGDCQAAIPLLQVLIGKDPRAPNFYMELGRCYLSMKEYDKAIPVLRKVVELNPDMTLAHFQLARALLGTKDFAAATHELQIIVEKIPRWPQPHLMLATAYAQSDRAREAVTECEKVLEVVPKDYDALLLEGRILLVSKQPEAALPRLKKAAALRPEKPWPHILLADAYLQLGREGDAERERTAAKHLDQRPSSESQAPVER